MLKTSLRAPHPSVALVLDGKRVDYDEVARLGDRPLCHIATTLEGGKPALVINTELSVAGRPLVQSVSDLAAVQSKVEKALAGAGLTPGVAGPTASVASLMSGTGVRIFENVDFGGDSTVIAPNVYIADLRKFRKGRELFDPGWGDVISSLEMLGRCTFQAWEMKDRGGQSFFTTESVPNLDIYNWSDDFSSLETFFVNN